MKAHSIIQHEIDALSKLPKDNPYEEAIALIHDQVHHLKGKLVVSGMGKAGQIGHNISTTFSSTGTPAVFLHPSESQHGDLGILQENDVLLLISNSGKTREILELIELARNLNPKVQIISITGNPDSVLGKESTICLSTGMPEEVCPLGLTPTTSTTCMTVLGDIIVVMMMEKIEFTKEEYAKRHHSGYLGQKARS